jgi:hypothetical protein
MPQHPKAGNGFIGKIHNLGHQKKRLGNTISDRLEFFVLVSANYEYRYCYVEEIACYYTSIIGKYACLVGICRILLRQQRL